MLAASIESFFVLLLIAAGSALFNWLKKRGEKSEDWSDAELPRPPQRDSTFERGAPPPVSQPPSKATNWEEELRRMLEGTTAPQPPPVRTPPPVVIQERKPPPPIARPPMPAREAPTMSLPKSFEQKYYKAHCNHCDEHIEFPSNAMEEVISCPHCDQPTVLRPFGNTRVETLTHQADLSSFALATKKYDAASHLSERVAAHMHGVGHQAVGMTSIESKKTLWHEVAETKALFKNAKTVRQAIIASLILGPPKAFES